MTTILQFTDPHLLSRQEGTLKGVPTLASLKLVLDRARQAISDPACVVVTGDLSHEETVAGYELLKEQLGDWVDRSLLIPGNHDQRNSMRAVFPTIPGRDDEPIWFRHEIGAWRLLGLDSHVNGETYGALSTESLDRLVSQLDDDADRPTLLFMHHHPVAVGSAWVDAIGLRQSDALAAVLARYPNIRGLFCGHIHQAFQGEFAGVTFHSTPSTAIQFAPGTEKMQFDLRPPGFRVIELCDGRFETRVIRLDELPFVPRDEASQ